MKIVKISKETKIGYVAATLILFMYAIVTGANLWILLLMPLSYIKLVLIVSYMMHRKRKKFGYSCHSFTIPKYTFEGFDATKDNFALIMPTGVHKYPKRKWYHIFHKKRKIPQ